MFNVSDFYFGLNISLVASSYSNGSKCWWKSEMV